MARKNKTPAKQSNLQAEKKSRADHLKPWQWKEGQTGNPNGRPCAGWTWAGLIREYGDTDCPPQFAQKLGLSEKPKWKEVVVAMAYRHAAKGNASILKTLVEYIDGRVPIEISFNVAERLKQEANDAGIDWAGNPALAAIIAAAEATGSRPGNNSAIGQA